MPELYGRRRTRADLLAHVGRMEQVAGVRLVELSDGNERGVRVLEFRTGTGFGFDVLVDRAFDIGRCELRGAPLAWESSVGFAGPWYAEREGLGFFRTWGGGLLTTCGLDHALFMATDTAEQYTYPPKRTEDFGLHGRVSNIAARLVGYGDRWEGDECVLWAEGEVVQAAVFGETLVLRRRIETRVGESRLTVADEILNSGYATTPHMLLYHINIGFPVVDEGSEVLVPASGVESRGEYPVDGYRTLRAPKRGFVEEVFEHELSTESDGKVPVAVVNRALGLGAYEVFDAGQLPRHFLWRMLGERIYVVGIEPCTNRTAGRLDARERGELIHLEPGETRRYDLELGALDGADAVERFAQRVDRVADGAA